MAVLLLQYSSLTMSDIFDPPERIRVAALLSSMKDYHAKYEESIENPAQFWGQIADQFYWETKPSQDEFFKYNFNVNDGPVKIEWMTDGKTNICYNCLDRHLDEKGSQVSEREYNVGKEKLEFFILSLDSILLGRQ